MGWRERESLAIEHSTSARIPEIANALLIVCHHCTLPPRISTSDSIVIETSGLGVVEELSGSQITSISHNARPGDP